MATTRRQRRPNVNTYRLGSLWIHPDDAEALNEIADAEGRTISDLVRQAIKLLVAERRIERS